MITRDMLADAIQHTIDQVDIPELGTRVQGKVRDIYKQGDQRILITTDRISAFDAVLGLIPFRGQVLNQLSAWWFKQTADIIANHMLSIPDPNVMIAREAVALPVEVVVRNYITGITETSLWTQYAAGNRQPYGIALPDGLKKNDKLPHPIITPTTKSSDGHDERITSEEVVSRGLVSAELWQQVQTKAMAIFQRGQIVAAKAGLILVDTKYEFGLIDGELALIDEVHTPDSSRFWTQSSYDAGSPDHFSKEYMREWFEAHGYTGDGTPPEMPDSFVIDIAQRYITTYEKLTSEVFIPGEKPAIERIKQNLAQFASHA